MPALVIRTYTVQYPDPIVLEIGDLVVLGSRDLDFPGWIWATASVGGKSGWVPEEFLTIEGTVGRSLRDYSARELSVNEGNHVTVLQELLGWALTETAEGKRGWLPVDHLHIS